MNTPGTILVIEDEQLLIDICHVLLKKLDYEILMARTGKEAIEIARRHKGNIELALLDIGLPDMEGLEVYLKLINVRPSLKVIICSGYSENGPGREILDAGADAFLQKPFSFSELSKKINSLFERRKEKRYKTRHEAVVIQQNGIPVQCKIVDISRSGIAFCYDRQKTAFNQINQLTIEAKAADLSLEKIPCKSVSDIESSDDFCSDGTQNIRHSILFGPLSPPQIAQLEQFIENHSIAD